MFQVEKIQKKKHELENDYHFPTQEKNIDHVNKGKAFFPFR